MAATIELRCFIERLWPLDHDERLYFAINYIVSIKEPGSKGPPAIWMQPWNWKAIDAIAVWGWTAKKGLKLLNANVLRPPHVGDRQQIAAVYDAFVNEAKLYPRGAFNPDFVTFDDQPITYGYHLKLAAVTADIATRPAPIQQNLNLSRYFWMAKEKLRSVGYIFAAPVLNIPGATSGDVTPTIQTIHKSSVPDCVWMYRKSSVTATCRGIEPLADAPPWLAKHGGNPTFWVSTRNKPSDWKEEYDDDPAWLARLRGYAAQLADIPSHIAGALAGHEGEFAVIPIQRLFYAALLDRVPGTQNTPGGADTTAKVATAAAQALNKKPQGLAKDDVPLTPAEAARLRDEYTALQPPDTWARFVSAAWKQLDINPSTGPARQDVKLREYWTNMDQSVSQADFRKAIVKMVKKLYADRITDLSKDAGMPTADRDVLIRFMQDALGDANAKSIAPELLNPYVPPFRLSARAHPFVIPVGDPATLPVQVARHVSGFGLIARMAKKPGVPQNGVDDPAVDEFTPWRAVTAGTMYHLKTNEAGKVFHDALDPSKPDPVSRPEPQPDPSLNIAILPLRPDTDAAGKQQRFTYDGSARAASDPLGDLAFDHVPTVASASGDLDPLLRLPPIWLNRAIRARAGLEDPPPPDSLPEDFASHMPAMKFGRLLQGASCALFNSGALPSQFSREDGSSPGEVGDYKPIKDIPKEAIYSELYLRRVPIGAPELFYPKGAPQQRATEKRMQVQQPFLSADSGVVPLDRELDRDGLAGSDAFQLYFEDHLERAAAGGTAPLAIGTLDLSTTSLSVSIDAVDMTGLTNATFTVTIDSLDGELLRFDRAYKSGFNKFDIRIQVGDTVENGTRHVQISVTPRGHLLARDAAPGTPEVFIKDWVAHPGARIKISATGLDTGGVITYRRPHVRLGNLTEKEIEKTGTSNTDPGKSASRGQYFLLAPNDGFVERDARGTFYTPSSHEFQIRRPAIDVITWDRSHSWKTRDELKNRRTVWAEFFEQSNGKQTDQGPTLVDDPAVTELYVEAVPIFGGGVPYAARRLNGPPQAEFKRSVAAPVKLNVASPGGFNTDNILSVEPGQIWELRFYSAVEAKRFDLADQSCQLHPGLKGYNRIVNGMVLFGPTVIRVEAARLITEADATDISPRLLEAIQPAFQPGKISGNELRVWFDRTKLTVRDADTFRAYVTEAELGVQEWRWMGRPFQCGFPWGTWENGDPATTLAQLKQWEESGGFNGRRSEDLRAIAARMPIYDDAPELWFEDISSDPRALYHRYRIRLSTRYAAITSSQAAVFSSEPTCDWKREFVPCRRREQAPKPRIRLVVPLTQGAEWGELRTCSDNTVAPLPYERPGSPGILVFAAERWYGFGGLNETLEVEAVNTRDEDQRVYKGMPEYGYDPIVTMKAFDGDLTFPAEKIIGPIGHTVDRNTDAPLFQACSFIIPAPVRTKGVPTMALVKFRRKVRKEGVEPKTELLSEPTNPVLVHFLPDPSHVFGEVDPADCYMDLSADPATVRDKNGRPIRLSPEGPREVWALINGGAWDAFGQVQERFLRMYCMKKPTGADKPSEFTLLPGMMPVEGTPNCSARLFEVERSPSDKTGETITSIWKKLFSLADTGDEKGGTDFDHRDDDAMLRFLPLTYAMPVKFSATAIKGSLP